MTTTIGTALSGWLPYKLQHTTNVRWLYMDDLPFTDPFFDDTICKSKQFKENSSYVRSVTSIDLLDEWSNAIDKVTPSAFIFHISRCGSTLLAQLLGIDNNHIVLAEPPFIDELLRSKYKSGGKDLTNLLSSAMSFYGQKRTGQENRLFVKTDSWHLFFYEQLRAAYPTIPFFLLYRQPEEVIASHEKKKGMHAVAGVIEAEIFSLGELPPYHHDSNHYMAAILEQYYKKMEQVISIDKNAYLINYTEGFVSIAEKVYALTNTRLSEQMKETFKERCTFDAKAPREKFKESQATDNGTPTYMSKAFAGYNKLEEIRLSLL